MDGDLEVETFFKMFLDTVKYREIFDTLYGREVHLFTHCHIKVRQFSSLCKIEIAILTLTTVKLIKYVMFIKNVEKGPMLQLLNNLKIIK